MERKLEPFTYRRLCALVEELGGVIALERHDGGWGLSVTIVPAQAADPARAGAFIFPSVDELEAHSSWLLAWLSAMADNRDDVGTLL